jgi:hypothetical protein
VRCSHAAARFSLVPPIWRARVTPYSRFRWQGARAGAPQNTVRVFVNNDKKDDGEEGTVIRSAGSTLALDAHARARLEQMEKLVQASDFEELNRMIRAESSKDLRTLLFSSKKIDTGALSGERYTFKIEPSPTG